METFRDEMQSPDWNDRTFLEDWYAALSFIAKFDFEQLDERCPHRSATECRNGAQAFPRIVLFCAVTFQVGFRLSQHYIPSFKSLG